MVQTRKVASAQWVPPFAQGLVRDLRVRWALEEAGLSYEDHATTGDERKTKDYRKWQPFGQVPAYQEDELLMFESGAIVLHIAEQSEVLMPKDPAGRARTITWMFAALNTVEPQIQALTAIDLFFADQEWAKLRRPGAVDMVNLRLTALAEWIEGREYLEDRFTAADLLMSTVLNFIRHTDIVAQKPVLEAYKKRCQARPAYQRAVDAQMATFAKHTPPQA